MFELSDAFIWSQILATLAFVSDLISFQCKEKRKILFFIAISSGLLSIHFWLLDAMSGALVAFLGMLRYSVAYFSSNRVLVWPFFMASITIFGFTYLEGLPAILVLTAGIFQTIGAFQPHDKRLRQFMMIGTSCWIIHNILILTPVGILIDVVFLANNLIGYWRFYGRK
jgi:hypothetical protein